MKKLALIVLTALGFMPIPLFSQLPNGSISPDFSLKDIHGNNYRLYDILDSGKYVILDFSTVWCHGCWVYHHDSMTLEKAWNRWGPSGDDKLRIFLVESDSSNLACLQGDKQRCDNENKTLGDWITGTPYPIIMTCAPANGGNGKGVVNDFRIRYFPTLYMICPDRKISTMNFPDTTAIRRYMESCRPPISRDHYAVIQSVLSPGGFYCEQGVKGSAVIQNYGRDTLKSCFIHAVIPGSSQDTVTWRGNLGKYCFDTVDIPEMDALHGIHQYKLALSKPNGIDTVTFPMDTASVKFSVFVTAIAAPLTESFSDSVFPPIYWTITPAIYLGDTSWRRKDLSYCTSAYLDFLSVQADYPMEMFLPPLDLSTLEHPYLTFELAMGKWSDASPDSLIILGSDNCRNPAVKLFAGSTFSLFTHFDTTKPGPFIPLPSEWRYIAVDLSSMKNSNKCILDFKGVSGHNFSLYVRNIRVYSSNATSFGINPGKMEIYPDPASKEIGLRLPQSNSGSIVVSIRDLSGNQRLLRKFSGPMQEGKMIISLDGLSNGMYFLEVITSEGSYSGKFIKN